MLAPESSTYWATSSLTRLEGGGRCRAVRITGAGAGEAEGEGGARGLVAGEEVGPPGEDVAALVVLERGGEAQEPFDVVDDGEVVGEGWRGSAR